MATKLNANPLGGTLGSSVGISGTMLLGEQQVHMHCGGYDQFNNEESFDCFALRVGSSGEVVEDSLSPLLQPPERPCHCSDSGRFVVAGGEDEDNDQLDVWVLDGVTSTWGVTGVELPSARSSSAGLLLLDLLICLVGSDDVGWSAGLVLGLPVGCGEGGVVLSLGLGVACIRCAPILWQSGG